MTSPQDTPPTPQLDIKVFCEICNRSTNNLENHCKGVKHIRNKQLQDEYKDKFDIKTKTILLPCGFHCTKTYLATHLNTKKHKAGKCAVLKKRVGKYQRQLQ